MSTIGAHRRQFGKGFVGFIMATAQGEGGRPPRATAADSTPAKFRRPDAVQPAPDFCYDFKLTIS
jgi:hypothetical protein